MAAPSISPVSRWPLVGRRQELDRIVQTRAEVGYVGVVLNAAAGVGKSRLAREAVAEAESAGAFTGWVKATRSAASVPLAACAELLPAGVGSDDLLELMRRSVATLRERAGDRPIVIGVDDAQLLDPTSAALVLHLATTHTAFLVVTTRAGEAAPDAIVSLWKDVGAVRLELQPLGERETGELVEAVLGGPVERGVQRWVYEQSRGNALYVRELLQAAFEGGRLTSVRGLWRLPEPPALSASLAELVEARMTDLTKGERGVIELLAFGEPLPLSMVLEMTDQLALAGSEHRGMVVVSPPAQGGDVRLAHPLYGEVVRAAMPVSAARALRLELAAAVQSRGTLSSDDALRVAGWLLDAGEPVPAELGLQAAAAAIESGDPALGQTLAATTVAGGGPQPESTLLLARAHLAQNHFAEAEELLAGVETAMTTQAAAAEYLEQRIATTFWGAQSHDEARALLGRAEAWFPGDDLWQQRLLPMRLWVASIDLGFAGTLDMSSQILARVDLDPDVRVQVEQLHLSDLFYSGLTQQAFELSERIRPSVPLHGQGDEGTLMIALKLAMDTGRDWAGFEAHMTEIVDRAVASNDHVAAGLAALGLGRLRSLQGLYRESSRWLAEAEVQLELHDTLGGLVMTHAFQVLVGCAMSDSAAIASGLERMRAQLEGRTVLPSLVPYVARAEAWAVYAGGDPPRAQEMLIVAADDLRSLPVVAAQIVYEAMRTGADPRRLDATLADFAARCEHAPLIDAFARHVAARVAGDGRALVDVAVQMDGIGAKRYAMEAAAHAAEVFAEEGRDDSARRAAAYAHELRSQGEGGPKPRISSLDPSAVALTRRESQIVELVRQGFTNTEIAERLVLSVRTVESHLYRAMHKLGVGDRREV